MKEQILCINIEFNNFVYWIREVFIDLQNS